MSKTYKEWMKNEKNIYKSTCKKTSEQLNSGQINVSQFVELRNKRGTDGPIYDIYMRMSEFYEGFPWNEDYNNMMNKITMEDNIYGIIDVDVFIFLFRCSLILYDQYHLKYEKKYSLRQLRSGIWGGFGGHEDYVFNNVRQTIKDDLVNNIIKDNKYLDSLQQKYSNKYNYEV